MGVILYLVLYGQFPYMPSGEATAASMKDAIKRDHPPLCFQKSQAQNALSLVTPGFFGQEFFSFLNISIRCFQIIHYRYSIYYIIYIYIYFFF